MTRFTKMAVILSAIWISALAKMVVILSERGPRRTLQHGGGESKDLQLLLRSALAAITQPNKINEAGLQMLGSRSE